MDTLFRGCDRHYILRRYERVRSSAHEINKRKVHSPINEDLAFCAALLHDIGYIPEAAHTGFHPLDGYNFLLQRGYPQLAKLICAHSSSPEEALLRNIGPLDESNDIIAKLITFWDVQVKQGGEIVSYTERIRDILAKKSEAVDTAPAIGIDASGKNDGLNVVTVSHSFMQGFEHKYSTTLATNIARTGRIKGAATPVGGKHGGLGKTDK